MSKEIILVVQSILSTLLVVLVLIQVRGNGIGRAFGGGQVSFTRRGVEKAVFKSTFVVASLFIVIAILDIVI